jgi:O-antigen/teichoic acid export membrane protein
VSVEAFVACLAVGAALLALWLYVRFPKRAPKSVWRIGVHGVAALALLHSLPAADSPATGVALAIGALLPCFVWLFLAAIWLLDLARSALGAAR